MKMFGKKILSVKKMVKQVKVKGGDNQPSSLLQGNNDIAPSSLATPHGYITLYVGKERSRFVVRTEYLTHPLFKMVLEKAYKEFGFDQKNGLTVPLSTAAFQEVMDVVKSSHGNFDLTNLIEELGQSDDTK